MQLQVRKSKTFMLACSAYDDPYTDEAHKTTVARVGRNAVPDRPTRIHTGSTIVILHECHVDRRYDLQRVE